MDKTHIPLYRDTMGSTEALFLDALLDTDLTSSYNKFYRWSHALAFDDVDGATFRLLPQVYRKFENFSLALPHQERMKGIYRYTFFRNHLLFKEGLRAIDLLTKAGVAVAVLKGAALTAAYYQDYGMRYMDDFDLFVEKEQVNKVLKILMEDGWVRKETRAGALEFEVFHCIGLCKGQDAHLDINWALNDVWLRDKTAHILQNETEPAQLNGQIIRILNPSYQVLHNCIHGVGWNPLPSFRWVVDLATILRVRGSEVEWTKVVEIALREKAGYLLYQALHYVSTFPSVEIPQPIIERLAKQPYDALEIKHFEKLISEPSIANLALKWQDFRLLKVKYPDCWKGNTVLGFIPYLSNAWGLQSAKKMPLFIVRKLFKRFMKKRAQKRV